MYLTPPISYAEALRTAGEMRYSLLPERPST